MARKKASRRSSVGGGGKFMRGLFPVKGIFASALLGAGAAMVASRYAPQVHPQQNIAIGFAIGGIPGAAAAWFLQGAGGGGNGIVYY